MRSISRASIVAVASLMFTATSSSALVTASGSGALECIAPAGEGGGWDFTCRAVSDIMTNIGAVDGEFTVTNMPGEGGGLAYRYVVEERNNDGNLIVATSAATTTRLAQGAYEGMSADQVRFAATASITFTGGSSIGGFDHLKPLMLLRRTGFSDFRAVRYVQTEDGSNA